MVEDLNNELRTILGDYHWVAALRAAVRHTSRIMGSYVSAKVRAGAAVSGGGVRPRHSSERLATVAPESPLAGGHSVDAPDSGRPEDAVAQQADSGSSRTLDATPPARPFAYVVPVIAKSSQLLFEEAGRCTKVSRLTLCFDCGHCWRVAGCVGHVLQVQGLIMLCCLHPV